MKIVVDTNIVFSGILNQKSRIGKILISEHKYFDFYSCFFLQAELQKHYAKLAKITNQSIEKIAEIEKYVTKNIRFIDEVLIPPEIIFDSEKLAENVDFDDVLFVALTKHINGWLWTGDNKLIEGLKLKGFDKIITTSELLDLIDEFNSEK